MKVIDHRFYPHIIDLVFNLAPIESFHVLRWVCRQWGQRVEAKFYHVRDFSASHSLDGRHYSFRIGQHGSLQPQTLERVPAQG